MTKIGQFNSKYRFLSNFYPCEIQYEGLSYPSVENAYQAAKALDPGVRKPFQTCTAAEAKKMGRGLYLLEGWDDRRLQVMEQLVREKFKDSELARALLATGEAELVEGNCWGDCFWGVCNGQGDNHLGKILMKVRGELQGEKHFVGKVTVKAIVRDPLAQKILLTRAPNILWELPGGRLNEGETLEQALERELKEELGLTPNDYWKPYLLINEQCLHVTSGSTILSVTFVVPLKVFSDDGTTSYRSGLHLEENVLARWIDEPESTFLPKAETYPNCWNAVQAFWRSYRSA